jgi:amino acid adenylation domain-containing protein
MYLFHFRWTMDAWLGADTGIPLDMDGPVELAFDRFDEDWLERTIVARFASIAEGHATRTAVADSTTQLSYSELGRKAFVLARCIASSTAPGRPVGILLPHNATFPIAALACLAAGRPYVPIDLKYPAERMDAIVREGGLGGVLMQEGADAAHRLPADIAKIDIDAACEGDGRPLREAGSPDDLAVILYTSGSTGKPKGICNNQRAILQRVADATNSCHIHPDDRILLLSSPGTIAGQREMFAALLNGASLHVIDPQADGIHKVLDTLERARITLCYAVPSLLRVLLRLPRARQAFASMRVVRVGGDVTLASDLALFREVTPASCRFFASFSSTETPAVFQWFVPGGWEASGPRVPIGYPRPGIDFVVLGEEGQPVTQGEIGELVVRSRYLALGQWQDGCLVPGPFRTDAANPALRILHTGDLVRQRADGLWELFGRKDRQIKIRGQRIDAGEVEAALRACADVLDVAVIARRKGEEVVALAAFVAAAGGSSGPRQESLRQALKQALQSRVPVYMHPADIHLVDALPQLPGFKPDIRKLEQLDRQQQEQQEQQKRQAHIHGAAKQEMPAATLPSSLSGSREQDAIVVDAVRYAWSNVLGAKSFAADHPWDEADGDSLKAIELWFYIEDRLGFKLPLDAVEENTTPSGLIRSILAYGRVAGDGTAQDIQRKAGPSAADAAQHDIPLVFLFPGILDDDPALARFRAAFDKQIRFRLIDYPPWRDTAAANGTLDSIVDTAVARICAEPACEVYRIAGYSFGGIIAFEVARRLVAGGCRVDFLGLIDTRRWDLSSGSGSARFHRFLDERPNWRIDWLKALIANMVRQRRYGQLAAVERLLMTRPGKLALWFKRRVTHELRYQAFLQWQPMPLAVPTEVYLSDDRWPDEPADFGWSGLCRPLHLVPVGGNHATVIQPPHRDKLCNAFTAALYARLLDDQAIEFAQSVSSLLFGPN